MDEAGASGTFTLLVDRPLSAVVRLAVWCPSMDLVAVGTADGHLFVRRLNWQALWSATPETATATAGTSAGSGSSVVWRPNGKALAVGEADGGVAVLDAEDGKRLLHVQLCSGVPDPVSLQLPGRCCKHLSSGQATVQWQVCDDALGRASWHPVGPLDTR